MFELVGRQSNFNESPLAHSVGNYRISLGTSNSSGCRAEGLGVFLPAEMADDDHVGESSLPSQAQAVMHSLCSWNAYVGMEELELCV